MQTEGEREEGGFAAVFVQRTHTHNTYMHTRTHIQTHRSASPPGRAGGPGSNAGRA